MKPLNNINVKKYINLHIHICPYTFQKENTSSFQTLPAHTQDNGIF